MTDSQQSNPGKALDGAAAWPRRLDQSGSWAYVEAFDRVAVAPPRRGRGGVPRTLREFGQTVALALLMFFASRAVVQGFEVEGPSMQPTYHTGQRVFVNKALYARLDWLTRWLPVAGDGRGGMVRLSRAGAR
ncbi:MAG: S26 family signal peptidase [Dehalococcoidia bacterium]